MYRHNPRFQYLKFPEIFLKILKLRQYSRRQHLSQRMLSLRKIALKKGKRGESPFMGDIEELPKKCPYVPMYGPCTVRIDNDVRPGSIMKWCTCGLSKNQPWCDNESHKSTSFKPLSWKVPENQTIFSICNCKYTR